MQQFGCTFRSLYRMKKPARKDYMVPNCIFMILSNDQITGTENELMVARAQTDTGVEHVMGTAALEDSFVLMGLPECGDG